jgi:putative flippase GtrA
MAKNNRLLRYLVVGGTSYIIEMGVLYGLEHGTSLDPVQSVAISFWTGLVAAFILQKYVAFQNHDNRKHIIIKQAIGYCLLVAVNYVFTLLFVGVLQHIASVLVLRTAAIAIITLWNYVVYTKLFKLVPPESDGHAE